MGNGCNWSSNYLNYILIIFQFQMFPNVTPLQQGTRSNIQCLTEKILPHTPVHKQPMATIKKIGDYSYALSDQIGIGLTSKVFKGKNTITNNTVAIKCIDLKKQMDHLSQEFLKQQIATLEKIKAYQSNYLLKLEAVILTANNLYIVTQFCEGKDLGKILRQKKTLSQQQSQSIMRQMIWGYRQLFGMGLIHRDLKLSNLFVTGNKVKIADFGFAISQDKCNNSFSYNAGSPKYMPPESLRFNMYSFKSDAWAMGVMAYEMVYGHAPWQSNDQAKLYDMINSVPIQTLFESNIAVSDNYKNFIVNCLRPNTAQRASPEFVFNYQWPLAENLIQGYQEQKKTQEVIKIPGKNYAIFSSSNQISYESKQLDVEDFSFNNSNPTQFIILNQLSYCRFLFALNFKIKSLSGYSSSQMLTSLSQQIEQTIQILMKILGEVTCMQKNRLDAPNFDSYIKTGQWQNLKQLVIRYDLQFRGGLQNSQLRKNSTIPMTSILPQTISSLKLGLPQNARLIDQLITYYEIRQILASSSPLQFAEKVNMVALFKQVQVPDSLINKDALVNGVVQRLSSTGL